MSRFFFHVYDEVDLLDQEGSEFASIEDARRHAVITAGEMIREHRGSRTDEPWRMTVLDPHGLVVCQLSFQVS